MKTKVSRPAKVTRIKDALSTTLSTNPSTNRAKLRYSKDSSQNERSAGFVGTAAESRESVPSQVIAAC